MTERTSTKHSLTKLSISMSMYDNVLNAVIISLNQESEDCTYCLINRVKQDKI